MKFSKNVNKCIKDLYKKRDHVELTIGTLNNGMIETVHYGPDKMESAEQIIYPVGSIGKPFTASLLAKLMDEGKFDLNAHVDDYIPGLPNRYYPTMLRMLTHHSGYGGAPHTTLQTVNYLLHMNEDDGMLHINPYRGFPDEAQMIETLKTKKLKDQDYKFSYSNFSFGVLGYIAGKLNNTDYYGAMEDYIASLGLKNTSLENSHMTGYDTKGNPCQPWQWERTDIVAPAGALLSTVEDLLKFAEINFEEEYLKVLHKKYAEGEKPFDQGLAWRIKKGTSISYHVGNAGGFSCILAMDLSTNNAVAIGLNYALTDVETLAFALLDDLNK